MLDLREFARRLRVRVFSNDIPDGVAHPYILLHVEDYQYGLARWGRFAELIMLDIMVHRFQHVGEYPPRFIHQYIRLCRRLAERLKDRFIAVLPDCPFDPRYFHGSQYPDNVRKTYMYHLWTLKSLEHVFRKTGSKLVLVVQHRVNLYVDRGNKLNESARLDIERSCIIVEDLLSFLHDENVVYGIGVGSLCVNRSPRLIAKVVSIVAEWFRGFTIHGFGTDVRTLQYLANNVLDRYSFDTTGWTKPTKPAQLLIGADKRRSCRDSVERTIYFIAGLATIAKYCNQQDIYDELFELAYEYAVRRLSLIHI